MAGGNRPTRQTNPLTIGLFILYSQDCEILRILFQHDSYQFKNNLQNLCQMLQL